MILPPKSEISHQYNDVTNITVTILTTKMTVTISEMTH